MLDQRDPASWPEDADRFRDGRLVVRDRAQREREDDRVEVFVGVGERRRVAKAEAGIEAELAGAPDRPIEGHLAELDAAQPDIRRVEGQSPTGTDADFERFAAGLLAEPAHVRAA